LVIMLRRPLAAFLILAALLAAGVFLLPRLLPDAYLRRQLAHALDRETGIMLEKAEAIRLTLLPRPGIVLEQAAFRASGPGEAPAVRAERVTAEIHPWPLLERRLELKRLLVEKPAIVLRIDASGRSNWDFTLGPRPRPPVRLAALGDETLEVDAAAGALPTLRSRRPRLPTAAIEIRQGAFSYLDEKHGRRIDVEQLDLSLKGSAAEGTVALDGGFRLLGEDITVKAALRDQLTASDPAAPLHVEIGGRALSAVYEGLVSWREARGLQGQLKLTVLSGAALRDWFGGGTRALAALDGASLTGTLDVGEHDAVFSDGRIKAGEATGDLALEAGFDGRARFNLHRLDLHGGRAAGHISVDARQPAAIVAGSFDISDVDTLALFSAVSGFDWLSGRGAGTLHIAAGGDNLPAILASLTGEGSITVSDGAIEGLDLPALIGKAREGEFKQWRRKAGQRTRFDSLKSAFTLDKGLAKSRELVLAGPEISATGEGETNIPAQSVDYRLKVKVKAATGEERAKAEDGEVEIPLILRGDWEKPDIYPDLDKVMRDPKAVSDTAKAIGKSVEKFTEGKIKSEDVGKALESLFGGKKKKQAE
jgi:uncharacterized protein involved in outer membrane biogenesis